MVPDGSRYFPAGWNVEAKPCDFCTAAVVVLFCRIDASFLYLNCDAEMQGGGAARHGRVWLCEVCENTPAVIICKDDAAALCAACDRDIHAENSLADLHERTPVVPFYGDTMAIKFSAAAFSKPETVSSTDDPDSKSCQISDSSWISADLNPNPDQMKGN